MPGKKNDLRVGPVPENVAEGGEPVHDGHLHVKHHNFTRALFHGIQGFLSVARSPAGIASPRQALEQDISHFLLVIHEQYARFFLALHTFSLPEAVNVSRETLRTELNLFTEKR